MIDDLISEDTSSMLFEEIVKDGLNEEQIYKGYKTRLGKVIIVSQYTRSKLWKWYLVDLPHMCYIHSHHPLKEAFTNDSDPIRDMGFGMESLRRKIRPARIFNVLDGLNATAKKILSEKFETSLDDIYFLADNENLISFFYFVDTIEEYIKNDHLIFSKTFLSGGNYNERCMFKLYETEVGLIGTFMYTTSKDSNSELKQYIGNIEAAHRLNLKQYI